MTDLQQRDYSVSRIEDKGRSGQRNVRLNNSTPSDKHNTSIRLRDFLYINTIIHLVIILCKLDFHLTQFRYS